MCQKCRIFLEDFLKAGTPSSLPLTKQIRAKSLSKILPELTDWVYRFHSRVQKDDFDSALKTASRIAKRGRSNPEYEFLIHTATFNLLKFQVQWIRNEVLYLQTLLVESGFIRTNKQGSMTNAYDYISFMTPRSILCLQELHDDHIHPKGLLTDLRTFAKVKQEDETTCFDRDDDYQKEILEEDTDDLYT
jgi:hypothetical protein